MLDPRKHNHIQKLLAMQAQGQLPAGRLSEIDVLHDDWCGIYVGDYCNCHPEIRLRTWRKGRRAGPSMN
jgi:hypothetical protein